MKIFLPVFPAIISAAAVLASINYALVTSADATAKQQAYQQAKADLERTQAESDRQLKEEQARIALQAKEEADRKVRAAQMDKALGDYIKTNYPASQ